MPLTIMAAMLWMGPDGARAPAFPQPGSVAIVVNKSDDSSSTDAVTSAVKAWLGRQNYVILPDHGRYRIDVAITREGVGEATTSDRKVRPVVSLTHAAVGLPTKRTSIVALDRTRVALHMTAVNEGITVWHAEAITVRPRGTAQLTRLVDAALASFPRSPPQTVSVP